MGERMPLRSILPATTLESTESRERARPNESTSSGERADMNESTNVAERGPSTAIAS
jgi:hypothetical protein